MKVVKGIEDSDQLFSCRNLKMVVLHVVLIFVFSSAPSDIVNSVNA